ncbi:MAG: ribonuclease [Phycisphaerales bacterium]|nr:ribonuclease [Phycisphaerales bacterium]
MIIAGIDEAGYGPLLGPLASAACAFYTPDAEPTPCLWARLKKCAGKSRCKKGRKLHINDSKAVYSPSAGVSELERAVLCLAEQVHGLTVGLDGLLAMVDPDVIPFLAGYAWYRPSDPDPFPLAASAMNVRIATNAYTAATAAADTRCVHYRVRLLPERQYNDMTAKTKNKASTLFSLAARHLDDLIRTYSDQNLLIVCDRQGGRSHYGDLLRMMFEDWSLRIVDETTARAEYLLTNGDRQARIIFQEKAEAECLPVAAASMLAKYTREALMHRFNRYWKSHDATLKPTAGYYNDGLRFLEDIKPLRERLGIDDFDLIRTR